MSFHYSTISRRQFLAIAGAAATHWTVAPIYGAGTDADRWALLSDTHIAADPSKVTRDVKMSENLAAVVDQVLSSGTPPANLLVSGDLALGKGDAGDYATLLKSLEPIGKRPIATHLLLGNHDHRDNFRAAFAERLNGSKPIESKHVAVVEGQRANWFLLDSLEVVNATPGHLGEEQLIWLAAALDARKGKPAIVVVHHNPQFATAGNIAGLKDTDRLFEVLSPRRFVKALFFGHIHHWNVQAKDGIHLVSLPPVAYLFFKGDHNGWTDVVVSDNGLTMTVRALDKKHALNGQEIRVDWRTDVG